MAEIEPQSLVRMLIWLTLLVVVCVSALCLRAFLFTPRAKPPASPPETPSSALRSEIASVREDVASLQSTLEKNSTTLKRLSSRAGMREIRERRESASAPPQGAPKAELYRHYGMSGKVGPAFAVAQLQLERTAPPRDDLN